MLKNIILNKTNYAIPLYFDESLSYYEQLCAMYNIIKDMAMDVGSINEAFNVKDEVLSILKDTKIDGNLEITGDLIVPNFQLPPETSVDTLTATLIEVGRLIASGTIEGAFKGELTGNVNGNSETASKLETPRLIKLIGDVTGQASFDGSNDIDLQTTIVGVTTGDISTINNDLTINGNLAVKGISATENISTSKDISASTIHGTLDGIASSAVTANFLSVGRTISITGDATGSAQFDGSENVSLSVSVNSASTSQTATKLLNERAITLEGDVIGSASFDGSENVAINTKCNFATNSETSTHTSAIKYGTEEPTGAFGNDGDIFVVYEA